MAIIRSDMVNYLKIVIPKSPATVAQLVPYFLSFWRKSSQWVMVSSFTRFLDHSR